MQFWKKRCRLVLGENKMNYLDVIDVLSRMEEKMVYIKLVTYTKRYQDSKLGKEENEEVSEYAHCA